MTNLRTDAARVIKKYQADLDAGCEDEFVHFQDFISHTDCENTPRIMLTYITTYPLVESSFPNVSVALRIYLTLPVTVCEADRSFSKLGLIKNARRSTINQKRLNALVIMSIEYDVTHSVSFTHFVDEFSSVKARKKYSSLGAR